MMGLRSISNRIMVDSRVYLSPVTIEIATKGKPMAEQIPYGQAIADFEALRVKVLSDREPIELTSNTGESVSLLPTRELEALLETVYLFGNQENGSRLLAALQRSQAQINTPRTVESLREEFGLFEDEVNPLDKVSA
jgi:antitoxin YefM